MKYLTASSLLTANVRPTSLEAGSLRFGCQHDQVLVKAILQVARCYFFCISSWNRKRDRTFPFLRARISFLRTPNLKVPFLLSLDVLLFQDVHKHSIHHTFRVLTRTVHQQSDSDISRSPGQKLCKCQSFFPAIIS